MIYEIDAALANGSYRQDPPKPILIVDPPSPPFDMDIPIWDDERGEWYDAEY